MAAFVIRYDRIRGLRDVFEFEGSDAHRRALAYRLQLEAERLDQNVEIASLNSDSLATVKKTHFLYFQSNFALS